jgi:Na+-driven multidrug efflux pump
MANIKHYSNCGVCGSAIATANAKAIGASLYCSIHYSELIKTGFDKTLGNPIEALGRLSVGVR